MPGISTHIAFSRLLLSRLGEDVEPCHFLLGTIAPDTFDRNEDGSFQLHHFARPNGESDLERLRDITGEIRRRGSQCQISFADGYLAHLWLDNHARLREDALEVKNPANLAGKDLRQVVRACIEYHDLSIIGDFLAQVEIPSVILESVPGLEFIPLGQAVDILQRFKETNRTESGSSNTCVAIDAEGYRRFLSAAVDEFLAYDAKLKGANGQG